MDSQVIEGQLLAALTRAKELVSRLVNERMDNGDYGGAKAGLEWAQMLDSIHDRLNHRPETPMAHVPSGSRRKAMKMPPPRLPYYYRDGDRLVKIGASKSEGEYRHDVPKENFDQIIGSLKSFAKSNPRFETKQLQNRLHRIPRHQHLIVLAVLRQEGLVVNTSRGRWAFANPEGFPLATESVWQQIPTE